MTLSRSRRGFTLVELLVVTGLIASLFGLVVAGMRRGQQSRKPGADTLAAVLAAAQGRALGLPEGTAVILSPDSSLPAACATFYDASMLPLIQGVVTGVPPANPAMLSASGTVVPMTTDSIQRAYKILLCVDANRNFAPPTAWLNFTPTSATTGTVQFRTSAAQTSGNTVWPKPTASGTMNGLLAQYPIRSTSAYQLDKGTAVDLSFSGIGDDRTTAYGRLDGKGSIAVVFERTGRVAEILQQVPEPGATAPSGIAQPAMPTGTVYFLVAPRDVIASGGNTLASSDAIWVALSPQTGRTFTAANIVQSGTDTAALQAARANARKGIAK